MGLVDALVDRSFRETKDGLVVVFSGDPRKRGYLVRSLTEESKTRAFLKMFYFAHLYLLLFGLLLAQAWASWMSGLLFERPAHHLLGTALTSVAIYCVVVALPYYFLWRAYRRALESFGAPADEVPLTGLSAPPRRQWILLAFVGFAILVLAAILALTIRATSA